MQSTEKQKKAAEQVWLINGTGLVTIILSSFMQLEFRMNDEFYTEMNSKLGYFR